MSCMWSATVSSRAAWLTSMRCELTFFPFLFQLTLGLGSPVAWQTKETTPPETPIWSTGTFVNRGCAEEGKEDRRGGGGGKDEGETLARRKKLLANELTVPFTAALNKCNYKSERTDAWIQTTTHWRNKVMMIRGTAIQGGTTLLIQ